MQVTKLRGQLLDYWVGRAQGLDPHILPGSESKRLVVNDSTAQYGFRRYEPSSDWSIAGRIIDSERISLVWAQDVWKAFNPQLGEQHAYTDEFALVAAMRCYVASKFGELVPDQKDEAVPPNGVERRSTVRSRELPGNDTIH